VAEHSQAFAAVSGLMIGRMAVVRPWVFAEWQGGLSSAEIDHLEVWRRFAAYVTEDFTPGQAYYRIRAFTAYYARNFHFGHTLFAATQAAPDLETLRERAIRFLASKPQLVRIPNLLGLA
jgi:tRNA-dihydrouridine synthase